MRADVTRAFVTLTIAFEARFVTFLGLSTTAIGEMYFLIDKVLNEKFDRSKFFRITKIGLPIFKAH